MTGPNHFRKAEELAAKAAEYLGQGDGQATAAVWAAVAQVHATLALAAATAVGTRTAGDSQAWDDVAATKFARSRFTPRRFTPPKPSGRPNRGRPRPADD
jgi:hypothetical protein